MEPIDFEQLKKQYGEILVLETDDAGGGQPTTLVFKKAEMPIVQHYFDTMTNESLFSAAKSLEMDLLVSPSLEEFSAYIFKNPCVVMDLMPALRAWIGSKVFREKKV